MKKTLLPTYHETLYHLIQFRISQFNKIKKLLKIDYDSFMICSVTAAHFNFKNLKLNKEIDWDQSWELARSASDTSIFKKDKLTIFSVSQILLMPKESVRRKLKQMIKMKILKYSTKTGVIFGEKIDIFKPYAKDEVLALSTFLKSLKHNGALQNLLDIKKNDIK